MLGSDIVDLLDPEARPEGLHPRFDRRVFAPCERERLRESGAPGRLRWMMWAAKEAAFKAARRIDRSLRFSPSRFVVDLTASGSGRVAHDALEVPVAVTGSADFVHAVAARDPGLCRCFISEIRAGDDPGRVARRLAIETASEMLDLSRDRLSVSSDDRIPLLCVDGTPAPLLLSISHHGRYASGALAPIEVAS